MEYILGIDVGTGSVKAVAVTLNGDVSGESQQHYSFSSPKPGYHEQNPKLIYNAFIAVIQDITGKTGAQPLAVGLSTAMHSLIPVDENCNALAAMMTWADSRSWAVATQLRASPEGLAIYTATGTPLHAMSPLCKLIWLKESDPVLFKKAHKFISIKDYIWYRLFNEFKTDYSIASGMGLFNISKYGWHTEALKLAGIEEKRLSDPVPTGYTKGYDGKVFSQGTPVTIGASDGCLANLGSMAVTPGTASITVGTSGAVRIASVRPLPNADAMTFSYILDNETYICGGPVNNGGVAMQWWLKNFIGSELSDDEYEEALGQVTRIPPGSNGLIFLPYLTGERAPIWDSESCGTFFGIRLQHTRVHFSKAVLEGICFAIRDVLEAVQQNAEPITCIKVSGGFIRSFVWLQTLADVTGKTLTVAQSGDASAVGAAYMAMKASGLVSDYPMPASYQQVFKPDPANAAKYDQDFRLYKQLYADLKETMHQLYEVNN